MHPTGGGATIVGSSAAIDFSSSAISPSLSNSFSSTSSAYQTFNNSSTTVDSMILNTTAASSDFGPIPISPHVNVPNAHNIPPPMPPPLPPRVKRKESSGESSQSSQVRQAPDAPRVSGSRQQLAVPDQYLIVAFFHSFLREILVHLRCRHVLTSSRITCSATCNHSISCTAQQQLVTAGITLMYFR